VWIGDWRRSWRLMSLVAGWRNWDRSACRDQDSLKGAAIEVERIAR
jgi:hypothetical protein